MPPIVTKKSFFDILFTYPAILISSIVITLFAYLNWQNNDEYYMSEGMLSIEYAPTNTITEKEKNLFFEALQEHIYAEKFTDNIINSLNRNVVFQLIKEYHKQTPVVQTHFTLAESHKSFFNGIKKLHLDKNKFHYQFQMRNPDVTRAISLKIQKSVLDYIDQYNLVLMKNNTHTHVQNKHVINRHISDLKKDITILNQLKNHDNSISNQPLKEAQQYKERYTNIEKYINKISNIYKNKGLADIAHFLQNEELSFYNNKINKYATLIQQQYQYRLPNQMVILGLQAKIQANQVKAQKVFVNIVANLQKKTDALKQKYTVLKKQARLIQKKQNDPVFKKHPTFKKLNKKQKNAYIEKLKNDLQAKESIQKTLSKKNVDLNPADAYSTIKASWQINPNNIVKISQNLTLKDAVIILFLTIVMGFILKYILKKYFLSNPDNIEKKYPTAIKKQAEPQIFYWSIPEYTYTHNDISTNLAAEVLMLAKSHPFKAAFLDFYSYLDRRPLKPGHVLFMVSYGSNMGLTLIAINLARIIANNNEKVLLIEFTQSPNGLKNILNLTKKKGLTDFLIEGASIESIINKDPLTSLNIIPYGNKNVSIKKFLPSQIIKNMIAKLKKSYQYIIIDSGVTSGFDYVAAASLLSDDNIIVADTQKYDENKIQFLTEAFSAQVKSKKPFIALNRRMDPDIAS